MTAYVTLKAVKDGKITLDTLVSVSPVAAMQSPSKMGFRPGTQVTVDNALKMMLVKSANDMAVVLAEGVGGSVDGFSAMMNETAQKLGMTQTSYVNPNGLPAGGAGRPTLGSRLCKQWTGVAAACARHRQQSGADRRFAAEPARRDVRRQAQAAGQR